MALSFATLFHQGITFSKQVFYGKRGEPYHCGRQLVRYIPGTRPVRLKYADSPIGTVRNDVKQLQFFLDGIRPGDFVLDIGANVGQYAVFFAALVSKSGKVISFEPDPTSRKMTDKNLALNSFQKRVTVEELALFDENTTRSLYSKAGGDATASLVRSGLQGEQNVLHAETVTTVRLDDYLSHHSLPTPSWVKIDVEGAEINVLKGAPQLLASSAVIVCELHPYAWSEFGTSFEELLELVKVAGKKIVYLDDSLKIEDGPVYGATIIS